MISSTKSVVYELPKVLTNNLKLRILVNLEILKKIQKWVDADPVSLPEIKL